MFSFPTLLSTLLLALAVSANPVVLRDNLVRLPFAKHVNVTSIGHILKNDQDRAAALRARGEAHSFEKLQEDVGTDVPVQSQAMNYVASVGVGSPPTYYSLLIDSGSSNTFVGAGKAYTKTSTGIQTGNKVSALYGSGSFQGVEFTDTVALGEGLTITKQSIGVASSSMGFEGVDGILGIGPVDLTEGTLSPDTSAIIPTVTDNLFSQGKISSNEVGISFQPTMQESDGNGELTFGGVDSTKFTGSIYYQPITSTRPASDFWGIDQSIRYGDDSDSNSTMILSTTAGIIDTGTTLILIATDAFKKYKSVTGGAMDQNTGLLRLSQVQFSKLQSLFFTTGGARFELTANAQAWPRSLNSVIGCDANSVYLIIGDLGTTRGQGLDFICGFAFLERFYTVLDTENRRIGLATTPFTDAETN